MPDPGPFHDLKPVGDQGAFHLPVRKWREILFVGAMRETEDGLYVRDPSRPLPPLRDPGLFASGRRFRAEKIPDPPAGNPDPPEPADTRSQPDPADPGVLTPVC